MFLNTARFKRWGRMGNIFPESLSVLPPGQITACGVVTTGCTVLPTHLLPKAIRPVWALLLVNRVERSSSAPSPRA